MGQSEKHVSFTIGGDVMFARNVAHTLTPDGLVHAFDRLDPNPFLGSDARIINLEGALSDKPVPDHPGETFIFVFNPQAVDALKKLGINGASLANNHSNNAGTVGLARARRMLRDAGIQAIGGPRAPDVVQIGTFPGDGLTLDIIGVHMLVETPDITPLIHELKENPDHRVMVFPHWGVEYELKHSSQQERFAHAWIDAGADIVIGSHPHVVQDIETYNGKPIIYSLGNLLFDQHFSKAVQHGMIIQGTFTEHDLEYHQIPIQIVNYHTIHSSN